MSASPQEVTSLLIRWREGDRAALDQLTPLIYDELRRLARSYLRRERPDHTLNGTALVHEAYLRLVDQRNVEWHSRSHFFALAAESIRRILVDHARARVAAKRGGANVKLSLDEALAPADEKDLDMLALDDALKALASADPQQSRIVELRYFAGLTIEETADVLGISPATVKREWTTAKAFLKREMLRKGRV
ncbi:MAG TPA: sigma-70 family RNA polymerase sigma factor [Bryobacteraceae bacterium]|nr:sigma-70 family RNA polymerase sigma factor [Bryobacteraceae bacterium]